MQPEGSGSSAALRLKTAACSCTTRLHSGRVRARYGSWLGGPPVRGMEWDVQISAERRRELLSLCASSNEALSSAAHRLTTYGPYALYRSQPWAAAGGCAAHACAPRTAQRLPPHGGQLAHAQVRRRLDPALAAGDDRGHPGDVHIYTHMYTPHRPPPAREWRGPAPEVPPPPGAPHRPPHRPARPRRGQGAARAAALINYCGRCN